MRRCQLRAPQLGHVLSVCFAPICHLSSSSVQVLSDLEKRIGREATAQAWTSEMLLKYLEQSAYEARVQRDFRVLPRQFSWARGRPSLIFGCLEVLISVGHSTSHMK